MRKFDSTLFQDRYDNARKKNSVREELVAAMLMLKEINSFYIAQIIPLEEEVAHLKNDVLLAELARIRIGIEDLRKAITPNQET